MGPLLGCLTISFILLAFKLSVQKPTLSYKTVITRDWKSLHLEQLNYDIIRTDFRHSYHDFSECVYQYDNKLRTLLDVHAPRAGKPLGKDYSEEKREKC